MIILNKDKGNIHKIYIPKSIISHSDVFEIKIFGESTKTEYILNVVNQMKNNQFYVFVIDIKDLPVGEYKFNLCDICKATEDFDRIVSSGLMRIESSELSKSYESHTENKYYI